MRSYILNNKNLVIKQALIGWAFLLVSAVIATTLSVWLSANGLRDGPSIGVSIAVTGIPAAGLFLFLLQRKQAPVEPVTMILTALVAGASVTAKDVVAQAVVDAYTGLKALVVRKFGDRADVADALEKVEARPDSTAREGVLREELEMAGAGVDEETVRQAQALLDLLRAEGEIDRGTYTAIVTGSGAVAQSGGVAAGQGGVATGSNIEGGVHLGSRPARDEEEEGRVRRAR